MALLQAIEIILLNEEKKYPGEVFDKKFIESKTEGFESFACHLKKQNLQNLALASGIAMADIREVADILKNKKKIIACWAMGLTQHKNAVDTIKEIVNLLLLKGSIGKPGAGTCPVRGQAMPWQCRRVG